MINIERAILCSVLEHNFMLSDKEILKVNLNPDVFDHPHHKTFVKAINRLKELDEPICSDTLRHKFITAQAWDKQLIENITLENSLLEVMTASPFSTIELFKKYYDYLENAHKKKTLHNELRYL